jgi:hypothetical protein
MLLTNSKESGNIILTFNKKRSASTTLIAVLLLNIECILILAYLNFYTQELKNYQQLDYIYSQKIITFAK